MSVSLALTNSFLANSKPMVLLWQESQYTEPGICSRCVYRLAANCFSGCFRGLFVGFSFVCWLVLCVCVCVWWGFVVVAVIV